MSDFYVTYSGREIHPEAITEKDICLVDIAHHLTNINRYGGALNFNLHYSVAEHCLLLAQYVKKELNSMGTTYTRNTARMALLHDASEAYLGDIVSALKFQLPDYQEIENHVQNIIYSKYKISTNKQDTNIVKELDKRILLDESLGTMPYRYSVFKEKYKEYSPLGITITGQTNKDELYLNYLKMCKELEIED